MIRIGLIGCGYWGPKLLKALASSERCTVAILCDTSADRLAECAGMVPRSADVRLVENPAETIGDASINAVVIATPARSHASLSLAALGRGKHVLVEKPAALDAADASRLVRAAAEAGRVLMVDHTFLFHPAVEQVIRWVRAGRLGRVSYIRSERLNFGIIRTDSHIVWELAPHDLAILGALHSEQPMGVRALPLGCREGVAVRGLVSLEYPSGLRADLLFGTDEPLKRRRLTVWGEEGVLVFDDTATPPLMFHKQRIRREADGAGHDRMVLSDSGREVVVTEVGEPLKRLVHAFLDRLEDKRDDFQQAGGLPRGAVDPSGSMVLEMILRSWTRNEVEAGYSVPDTVLPTSRVHGGGRS